MATAQLSATTRADTGKGVARSLRRSGKIPGVIYGHARDPQPLSVETRELERLLERISAENTVIELNVGGTTARTLIREIQRHPVKRNVIHVDFQELVTGETVTVKIPLVLVGTPEGVRLGGGVLDQTMRELEVRVDPTNMPSRIDIDVSALGVGRSIHVSEVQVPAGVEVLDPADATVAIVAAPKTAAEGAVEEAGAAEPELIRKPKAEEGEEA